MEWLEVHLDAGVKPADFYQWLNDRQIVVERVHHFWDEPWNPGAYVVRVESYFRDVRWYRNGRVFAWDAEPDRQLYGEKFDAAMAFFQAGSTLVPSKWETGKLVHCFLNAQGMSWTGEVRWHLRQAYRRLKFMVQLKLYLGRRLERQAREAEVERKALAAIAEAREVTA